MSKGYARINFDDVDDKAAAFGMGDMGETRYVREEIGAESIGTSLYRVNPGQRLGFGHSHDEDEELYVLIAGTGRIKIDDEILDLRPLDVVRVAPTCIREFEGGDDGMTLMSFGTHTDGDGNMHQGFWPKDDAPAA